MRLVNVGGRCFFRVQIRVAGGESEIGDRLHTQLGFDSLGARRAKIERLEKAIKPDEIRQIVMKVSRADPYPVFPEALLQTDIPPQILFRF